MPAVALSARRWCGLGGPPSKRMTCETNMATSLQAAADLHRRGRLAEAERLYQDILARQPRHADALHRFGVLKQQTGRVQEAIDLLDQALSIAETNPRGHYDYGLALQAARRFGEAAEQFARAIRLQPDFRQPRSALIAVCRETGDWQAAASVFERLARQRPADAEAIFWRGVAERQVGRFDSAIGCFHAAIHLAPGLVEAHHNLASTLQSDGKPEEAVAAYETAIRLRPDFAEAHHGLASALRQAGRFDNAAKAYQLAIAHEPDRVRWRCDLGRLLHEMGRHEESLRVFETITHRWPELSTGHLGTGHALEALCQPQQAERAIRRAIELEGNRAAGHFALGNMLFDRGRFAESAAALRAAISKEPGLSDAIAKLSAAYRELGRFEDSLAVCRRAVARDRQSAEAVTNLAIAYQECGQYDRALKRYRRSIELQPNHVAANMNRALLLLLTGNFTAGWPAYEWRWKLPSLNRDPLRRLSAPQWHGECLTGKTLLVHAEQGVGDDIMFASCYEDLLRLSKHCIFQCDRRLVPLLKRSFPTAQILGTKFQDLLRGEVDPAKIDVQISAGSVPRYLRRELAAFPRRRHYLVADPDKRRKWLSRFGQLGAGLKVGISWQGGSEPSERRRRSIRLNQCHPLLATRGVHWINLQYGDSTSELRAVEAKCGVSIHDWPDSQPLVDLDDFAAKVSALDLVISVTNATVHFAGALGVPAWALVPDVPTWRWLSDGEQMPWYAGVRLFRQRQAGVWDGPLKKIAATLNSFATRYPR